MLCFLLPQFGLIGQYVPGDAVQGTAFSDKVLTTGDQDDFVVGIILLQLLYGLFILPDAQPRYNIQFISVH